MERSAEEQDEIKQGILETLKAIWSSDTLSFLDTERSQKLRPDILQRLLALTMTDDERAASLGLPEGCRIREGAKIIAPRNLVCGKNIWIGEGAVLDASGGLEIGEHTSVGLGVFIWSHTSHLANLTLNNAINSPLIRRRPTRIGRGCFIAGPSVICAGVEIGERCLIQPMSVVDQNIPPFSVVSGNPARVIKTMSERSIERMARALQS